MMRVSLAATPSDETCTQTSDPSYQRLSRLECAALKAQLLRMYPKPEHAQASIVEATFQHDFGLYRELAIECNNDSGADWAYLVEAGLPEYWDDHAKKDLALQGYPIQLDARVSCSDS